MADTLELTTAALQERLVNDALAYADNIIATLREPFLVLDKDLRVVTANRSFYTTFHVDPAATEHRLLYDLGNGQWNIPQLRTLLEEVLPQDHVFDGYEVSHRFPDIGLKVMVLNARRIRRPGNDSELVLLAIEDITDRKSADVAVQISETRYRRLFESAQDGILLLDFKTGAVIDVNQFMTDLLGYSYAGFQGKELWEIGLFKDRLVSETMMRDLQKSGYVRYENLPLQTERGRRVEVEVVANVYAEGPQSVIQCNIRDITERSRLERQAADQTAALSDLHRRKDEFLAMLSHELRNPLAPIANAMHLLSLQRGSQNPIEQQACAIIERQVGQLKHLIDDLLEISRISTGRIQLRQEHITLGGIIDRAVETTDPIIAQRRHTLTVTPWPEPLWVYADAARLEQVVVNLLNNAAKYTDEGGHIRLSVEPDGEDCVIRVRDTGVGIAPEVLPRIFDLFTQADRSLDRSQGGLGIGLSLVQRLVELHGGLVEAISVLGQGSEFVVRLPMVAFSEVAAPVPIAAAAPLNSCRVLVVDDNVDSAESLAMLLKASGHETKTAYDGPGAVETALEYQPEVVLLDIGLPGLNGFEVAKRIRLQPANAMCVLVAMTGYGQDTDRQRSLEAGFDHHLTKPADFAKVKAILAAVAVRVSRPAA